MARKASAKVMAFATGERRGSGGPAELEHRGFPRIDAHIQFMLWIGEGPERRFAATLRALNLSVSGAFLQSSFFLPVQTELRVSFRVDESEEPVLARARIVREERGDSRSASGKTGFGIAKREATRLVHPAKRKRLFRMVS